MYKVMLKYRPAAHQRRLQHGRPSAWRRNAVLCASAAQGGVKSAISLQAQVASAQPWVHAVLSLQEGLLARISSALPALKLVNQPTEHAPADGVLEIMSFDSQSSFVLRTFSAPPVILHAYRSTAVVPPMGLLLSKLGAHANMDKGTPFLDIEMSGNQESVLLAAMLTPRLNPLQHTDYLHKYWKSVPPGSEGLKTFDAIEKSMRAATIPYNVMSFIGDKAEAEHASKQAHSASTNGVAAGVSSSSAPDQKQYTYRHFYSSALYTRIATSTGVTFMFDPRDPAAVERVRGDVGALVDTWCAWVEADAADAPTLTGHELHECKQLTRGVANFLDHDEQTQGSVFLFGAEAVRHMKETVSGAASTAGTPWWDT